MRLLIIYLAILLLGVVLYTTFKTSANKKALYSKFFSFAIVVGLVYSILYYQPHYSYWLYSLIGLLSLYEIIKVTKHLKTNHIYISISFVILFVFVYTCLIELFPHHELFLCVLSFDAFSQFFGQIFGKRTLWKKISPNKTIEGCIGGLLICVLTSYLVFDSIWKGLLIAISALSGDLLASFIKRKAGVKDFGHILPAQGGILDRFDSYILSVICYLILFIC